MKRLVLFFLTLALFLPSAQAKPRLINMVCAEVGTEPPVLLSEVLELAQKKGISPKLAQQMLEKERILPQYAKQTLKFGSLDQIKKAAQEHVAQVLKNSGLSLSQFEQRLREPPYNKTLQQFVRETEYFYLKNQIMADLLKQVVISEDDLKNYLESSNESQVVFISIRPSGRASIDFQKGKEIIKQVNLHKSLDEVKKLYSKDNSVSFLAPMSYEKGKLSQRYENELQKYPNQAITEPFADEGGLTTMIWKIKKKITDDKLSETALEKARNSLYEKATERLFDEVVSSELANSPVVSNCAW